MLVLVINSGSSSLKYQVRDVEAGNVLTEGLVEKIGMGAGGEGDGQIEGPRDHAEALEQVDAAIHEALGDRVLDAVGHRVVHGGERFAEPVLVNNEITRAIERLNPLAPLHNPANVLGIRAISKKWPELPQVAVFDTAFHRTLPEHAWRYAVPDELYTNHGIRRYGFHGTSHEYVAHRAAALLDVPVEEFDAVIAHLGNGASVTAIRGGHSIDTSMGFTPLEGLVMGTRSGDVDPAIVAYLTERLSLSADDVVTALNKKSGLLGLSGSSSDMRDLLARREQGDEGAREAISVYCYRIRKYIGAYAVVLGGVDALVFTAGVGEHSPDIRASVCEGLQVVGLHLDEQANRTCKGFADIATGDSPGRILVIPTNEELMIARQALHVASAAT